MDHREFVVVGGSHGISEALVSQLVQSDAKVVVHCYSRSQSQLLANHPQIRWHSFDVTLGESPNLSEIEFQSFAGYLYAPGSITLKSFTSISLDTFRADFDLNVLGNVRFLQALLPLAKGSQLHPSFVFFSTVAVLKGMGFHSSIASAKGAVEALCKSLAAEYAPKMRFNCIAPSLTNTPLASGIVSREAALKASVERHPLGRIGTAREVAALAAFLLSNEASWMTGQIVHCDGGLSL